MNSEVAEILEHYGNGLFTKAELVNRLLDFSVQIEPQDYVPYLPDELVVEMKELVKEPPATMDKIFFLGGGTYKSGRSELEIKLSQDLQKAKAFGSAWRMYVYFFHA